MGLMQETLTNSMGGMGESGKHIVAAASSVVLIAGMAYKACTKIEEGEMGVRTHWGRTHRPESKLTAKLPLISGNKQIEWLNNKAYEWLNENGWLNKKQGEMYGAAGPGVHVTMPFVHSIVIVNTRSRTNWIPEVWADVIDEEEGRDDIQLKIEAGITWSIKKDEESLHKARFTIENGDEGEELSETVVSFCTDAIRSVTEGKKRSDIKHPAKRKELSEAVKEASKEDLDSIGVSLGYTKWRTISETFAEKLSREPFEKRLTSAHLARLATAGAIESDTVPSELRVVHEDSGNGGLAA